MASSALKEGFSLSEAAEGDLPSLRTIFPRAFHPKNAVMRRTFPDTPTIRAWWQESFKRAMEDPQGHVFVVKDQNNENAVIAVIRMRWFDSEEDGAGTWTVMELTEDHDAEIYKSMLDPMVVKRKKYVGGRPHYLIELFGTDQTYQGTGAGKALLTHCCNIADEKKLEVFVEANGNASTFYTRFGFVIEDEIVLSEVDYRECFLVRPPK